MSAGLASEDSLFVGNGIAKICQPQSFFFYILLITLKQTDRRKLEARIFKTKKKGTIFSSHMELKWGTSNENPDIINISEIQ